MQESALDRYPVDLKLALQALDNANDGITIVDIVDPVQPLIYVNKAFHRLTGYSANDILGKNCRFMQGNIPCERERRIMRNAMASREPCRVVIRNVRKNGEIFWNELSLAPITDSSGVTKYYVGIQKDISAEVEQREKILYLSEHDGLTNLYNSRAFYKYSAELFAEALDKKRYFGIGIADINSFKEINDMFGHLFGNNILKILSDEFISKFNKGDIISRMGGDEFIFSFMLKNSSRDWFFEKIIDSTNAVNRMFKKERNVSLSAGLRVIQATDPVSIDQLIRSADDEMYLMKKKYHSSHIENSE